MRSEMTEADSAKPVETLQNDKFRTALAGLMLAIVLSSLDQNIVATASPRIAGDLGDVSQIPWIVTAFMLSATTTTPIYGKLSDMYGRRSLFMCSIGIFLAASALCSLANDMLQMVMFRAMQGAGAGGLITLSQSAIGDLVGPRERGRYQGLFSGAMAVSTVAGPLLGGLLLAMMSWRWIFLVSLPLGALALLFMMTALPAAPRPKHHRIDSPGVVFWVIGMSSAMVFLSTIGSTGSPSAAYLVATGVLAVVFISLFLRREWRAPEPILSLRLFKIPSFAIGVAAAGTMSFAMQAAMVFLPLYFQAVLGQSPTASGLMLLPQVAGMMVSATWGGRRSVRSGQFKRYLVIGVGLETVALALLVMCALMKAGSPPFLVALAILGLGTGLGMPNAVVIVQNAVPRKMLGTATGSMSFIRSLGGAVGVALSGCVMRLVLGSGSTVPGFEGLTVDRALRYFPGDADGSHQLAGALRFAIAASFAFGAAMMLAALLTCAALPARAPDEASHDG
jgi:EmrB/QacA subfamily drug resistance transporter